MAEAKGLTVDAFIREALACILAERQLAAENPLQTAVDIVLERMRNVPAEVMARMPCDGASQHDHYIYGWPEKTRVTAHFADTFYWIALADFTDSAHQPARQLPGIQLCSSLSTR
jgi:hypothetical protein